MTTLHYPTLWLFGDSITEKNFDPDVGCWGSILANHLVRKCDVIQRGYSGYTTRMFRSMLPRLFTADDAARAKAVVIFFGANDCVLPVGRQHVPIDEYVANLNILFDYLDKIGFPLKNVVVLSPPPFDHDAWCKHGGNPAERSDEAAKEYADACFKTATTRGTMAINLNAELGKRNDWKGLLIDGLHLNREGANAVGDLLWTQLSPLLSPLPKMFPDSSQVNMDDPDDQLRNWEPPTIEQETSL